MWRSVTLYQRSLGLVYSRLGTKSPNFECRGDIHVCWLELIATRAFKRVLYIIPLLRFVLGSFDGWRE